MAALRAYDVLCASPSIVRMTTRRQNDAQNKGQLSMTWISVDFRFFSCNRIPGRRRTLQSSTRWLGSPPNSSRDPRFRRLAWALWR